jgi:hypothetical protein
MIKRNKTREKLEDELLDLINESYQMTTSDTQGCLTAILLKYDIKERTNNDK